MQQVAVSRRGVSSRGHAHVETRFRSEVLYGRCPERVLELRVISRFASVRVNLRTSMILPIGRV